ncbi:hypothetical protein BFG04_03910 [Campylobacter pinnipediorum subsp. pinnipediorum]|uniref:Uncharacterized protein n=2 Tax=Campylobacter TaxID=194 RepID=A0AAX0L9E7_9BACT|nr:hypothetical protein BFG04_03910 [Campylobacter pinnipediorum subsp. pinnipediorum]
MQNKHILKKTDTIDAYTKSQSDNKYAKKSELNDKLNTSTFNDEKSNFLLKSAVTNSLTS